MIFNYTKPTHEYYSEEYDTYEQYGDDFKYEANDEDVVDALVKIVINNYFDKIEVSQDFIFALKKFITLEELDGSIAEAHYDELKQHFKSKALKGVQ